MILSGKALAATIGSVQRILGTSLQFINIHIGKDNQVKVSGKTETQTAQAIFIAEDVEKSLSFSIDTDMILKAIGNKEKVKVELKSKKLKFSSGNFVGELATLPYEDIEVLPKKPKGMMVFTKDQKVEISKAIDMIKLTPLVESPVALHIQLKKGKFVATSTTDWHAAWVEDEMKGTDFVLQFPKDQISLYKTFFDHADDVNILTDRNIIYLWNSNIATSIPQFLSEDVYAMVETLVKSDKKPSYMTIVNSTKLGDILNSFSAVHDIDARVNMIGNKDSLNLKIQTKYGMMKDKIECETKKGDKLEVDFELNSFSDTVSKMSKKVKLSVFEGKAATLETIGKGQMKVMYFLSTLGKEGDNA